jgi:hypothetical protein
MTPQRRFRLCLRRYQIVGGEKIFHARLMAQREHGWSVVGVFQLTEPEWNELASYCIQLGIVVTGDAEESIVQA